MFLCCGEALYDLLQQGPGLQFAAQLGGSPLNVAIGLARLGWRSAFLGSIGNDALGDAMRASLAEEGVDTTMTTASGEVTSLALVTMRPDGVPDYAFHGLRDGATYQVPGDLPPAIAAIHAGSIGAAFGPSAPALLALLRAQRSRRLICYDPNPRPSIIPDAQAWRQRVEPIAACCDLIKVSTEDLAFLYPGTAPATVAARWLAGTASIVVVTDGPSGAKAFSNGRTASCRGHGIVVADTVGAGDAFQAALLWACAAHRALTGRALAALSAAAIDRILSVAVAASALACMRPGAAMPTRAALRAFSSRSRETPRAAAAPPGRRSP